MVIVWGSKLMGKCDVVPGLFHVATKFGHLWYIPLIPTGTYVVLGEDSESFRGVLVSMSFKSIALAWARAFLLVSAVASTLMAIMLMADGKRHEPWVGSAFTATVMWAVLIMLCYAPFITRASFSRAMQLAQELGLNQQGYAIIEKIYGHSAGRGFAVGKSVGATSAAAASPPRATASPSAPSRRPVPVDDGGAIPLEPPAPQAAPKPVAKPAVKRPNPPKIGL